MERAKVIRGLRIAVSAVCGILCVLLIVLWVRSYWWVEQFLGSLFGYRVAIGSMPGTGCVGISENATSLSWQIISQPAAEWWEIVRRDNAFFYSSRIWGGFLCESGIAAPYWFLILLSISFAAAPWLRWKFSLRTMLIATTLIAVLLGLVVWASR